MLEPIPDFILLYVPEIPGMEQLNPEHIILHALKHHLQTVLDFISSNKGTSLTALLPFIKTMGASQFDLYTGHLSTDTIKKKVTDQLLRTGHCTQQAYREWIAGNHGYRTLVLSDKSGWTLRFIDKPAFIHVHPSRYSVHTIRVKANAIKSVLCYLIAEEVTQVVDVTKLNQLRTQYLQLSPVSAIENKEEISKVYRLLTLSMK